MRAEFVFENINENNDMYLYILHGTKSLENVMGIKNEGYDKMLMGRGKNEGNILGAMVYPDESWHGIYGDFTIKFRVPIEKLKTGFLIWDEDVQKKIFGRTLSRAESFEKVFDRKIWENKAINSKEKYFKALRRILKESDKFSDFYYKFQEIILWSKEYNIESKADENEMWDLINKKFEGSFTETGGKYSDEWDIIESKSFGDKFEDEIINGFDLLIFQYRKLYLEETGRRGPTLFREFCFAKTENEDLMNYFIDNGKYKGFIGNAQFGPEHIYFGLYEPSLAEPIEYTKDGHNFIKL